MDRYINEESHLSVLQTVECYGHKDLEITYDLSSLPMSRANQRRMPEILHFYFFIFEVVCILKIKKYQSIFIRIGVFNIYNLYITYLYM